MSNSTEAECLCGAAVNEPCSPDCADLHDQQAETIADERHIARLITSSIAGTRWRDLTPLDIARHLVANGVRVVIKVER